MDKREHLVRVALELFYQHGIHAVGINRILAESGIAKKTLYSYFPAKEDLVLAALECRDQIFRDWLAGRMAEAPPGREALLAMFDALDDWFNNRVTELPPFHGCFFINASAEYGDPQHPVQQKCAAHKRDIQALVATHLAMCPALAMTQDQALTLLTFLKEGAIVQAHLLGLLDSALQAKTIISERL